VPACDGQTVGQMDGHTTTIYKRASIASSGKNRVAKKKRFVRMMETTC